jgi:dihydrofolate synthase/folylpolyglutamate synthase
MNPDSGIPRHTASQSAESSDDILERMEALFPEVIDLELSRVERLLEALGSPDEALPPVIHVAGTNGKGSVVAFIKAILEAAGKRVHTFTSPHLVRFHERISLATPSGAQHISEEALVELLARVETANAGQPITFFEITTAAAMLAFAEQRADYVILETGLGGRLDATNVVAQPAVTVIMPVSLDHAHYLGDTLGQIAGEKAGIMKPGVPCVVSRQEDEALAVIEARAEETGSPLSTAGRDWDVYEQQGRLIFQTGDALLDLPLPRLQGRHQIDNAGAAIAAARILKTEGLNEDSLAEGLLDASWPARLQRIGNGVISEWAGADAEILLDGGHNPAAAIAIARAMAEMEEKSPRPLHLICAMMATKSAGGFFKPFSGLAERVLTLSIPDHACHDPEDLAATARAEGMEAESAADIRSALMRSAELSDAPARVLICGSLYLAGEVLKLNEQPAK